MTANPAAGRHSFYAPCARGLESLLADELRAMRLRSVRPQRGGVLFAGELRHAYRALLWTRYASRVLLSLGEVDATTADALYAGIRDIAWEDHLSSDGTLVVDAAGTNDALRNTQFTAVRVKDAVADRFRDRSGRRPSVSSTDPDVRINIVVRGEKAKVSIDLSGAPLHRRGYREQGVQVAAPIKETLAAAVLGFAGWEATASSGGAFVDPLAGSGTLAIEAALIAGDVAPGLLRREWGFDRWLGHDSAAWDSLREEAVRRRAAGLPGIAPVFASDRDPAAIEVARRFVRRAGLESVVRLEIRELANVQPPAGAGHGLLASNPPYGERITDRRGLPALYGELSRVARTRFEGWDIALITSDESVAAGLSLHPTASHDVFNGRIPAKVYVFGAVSSRAAAARPAERGSRGVSIGGADGDAPRERSSDRTPAAPATDTGAQAFENRLRKMAKHLGTWARRTGVTCYRVYDADLPDYNVAIDLYRGAGSDEGRSWLHIAEYAPPADIDESKAAERLGDAVAVASEVLGVADSDIFVKRRERQRGSSQYVRESREGVTGIVAERGLLFEVNFSDYLDTGLFLDHRDTRAWVGDLAKGQTFLNLFAYTGTVSVHAAAGGAATTTTVDLSRTYLDWAGRNLERNGFAGEEHQLARADVSAWLTEAAKGPVRYGLIFCDPPTFSNSKRMDDTFDVQRDHVGLIASAAQLLAEDGTLVFSCNRRRFEMDVDALRERGLELRDVTRRTIPKDFERTPGVHSCWTVRRA